MYTPSKRSASLLFSLTAALLSLCVFTACGDDEESSSEPDATSTNTGNTSQTTGGETGSATSTSSSTGTTSTGTTGETGTTTTEPEGLILEGDDLFPEGVAYSESSEAFFFGSLAYGTVGRIDWDGNEETIFTPEEENWSTLGMKISPVDGSLVVCAVFAYGEPDTRAEIWAFDLVSKERTAVVDLDTAFEGANCNDVVSDAEGAVYVTDRENPNLYRVSLEDESAELFLTDPLLAPSFIGCNGIEITASGNLIVGKYGPAELIHIPLSDPSALSVVTLTGDALPLLPDGFDGIIFDGDILTIAGNSKLFRVTSSDDWMTADVQSFTPPENIAAVTLARGELYGLKGEIVSYVLGTDTDLPFGIYPLDGLDAE